MVVAAAQGDGETVGKRTMSLLGDFAAAAFVRDPQLSPRWSLLAHQGRGYQAPRDSVNGVPVLGRLAGGTLEGVGRTVPYLAIDLLKVNLGSTSRLDTSPLLVAVRPDGGDPWSVRLIEPEGGTGWTVVAPFPLDSAGWNVHATSGERGPWLGVAAIGRTAEGTASPRDTGSPRSPVRPLSPPSSSCGMGAWTRIRREHPGSSWSGDPRGVRSEPCGSPGTPSASTPAT